MLTSVEGNAVQAFSKGNNFLPHCVTLCWRFSLDDVHTFDVKFYVPNGKLLCTLHYCTLYTIIHFSLLSQNFLTSLYEEECFYN
jgi:hypothetical protein